MGKGVSNLSNISGQRHWHDDVDSESSQPVTDPWEVHHDFVDAVVVETQRHGIAREAH